MAEILAHRRRGEGPPLVLVHGYLGGAAHWQGQLAALSDRWEVIAPSLPGFGDSAGEPALARIEDHAARVFDLVDRLGLGPIALLGHSMGGMIAQEMAAMRPGDISALVLYGTGPRGALPGRFETIEASRQRLHAEGLDATVARIVPQWFAAAAESPGQALCLREGRRASLAAARASLDAWEAWDGRPGLARIAAPTLVLWGDRDRSYPFAQIEALWRGIRSAALAVVPDAGHAAHLERPELFNWLLRDFLCARAVVGTPSSRALATQSIHSRRDP